MSTNSVAASNATYAISWLEATFPELQNHEIEGDGLSFSRARAYTVFDASLVLQVYLYSKLDPCQLHHK
jgi:nuclear pore complex protein Nup88